MQPTIICGPGTTIDSSAGLGKALDEIFDNEVFALWVVNIFRYLPNTAWMRLTENVDNENVAGFG